MFERMEIYVNVYKGVLERSYKNILGKKPTMLVTAGRREADLPNQNEINIWEAM